MRTISPEQPASPENLERKVGELLLSGKQVGEGGKAVVIKISPEELPDDLAPAFEALGTPDASEAGSPESKAVKLFKLYLPNKGAAEYRMHERAYRATREIPEDQREKFARVPTLSKSLELNLDPEMKEEMARKFGVTFAGERMQLIAMEYVDGEDLATIYYKWILENERRLTPEETDGMNFKALYHEVANLLQFEVLPQEEVRDPRALELAEWKNNANNTKKLYDYLHKHKFPISATVVAQVENTINLMHRSHIIHGDAFERNIMVEGGAQALRENAANAMKQSYLIDFGESRDHEVEGVDDFAVIRRMKQLLVSPDEAEKKEIQAEFAAMDAKATALRTRNRGWQNSLAKAKKLAETDHYFAVTAAWNSTAGLGENYIEDFFIMAKDLIAEGVIETDVVSAFVERKKKVASSAFQKRKIQECARWLTS
jgi:serine/threonine protein kinase